MLCGKVGFQVLCIWRNIDAGEVCHPVTHERPLLNAVFTGLGKGFTLIAIPFELTGSQPPARPLHSV